MRNCMLVSGVPRVRSRHDQQDTDCFYERIACVVMGYSLCSASDAGLSVCVIIFALRVQPLGLPCVNRIPNISNQL